MKRFIPAVSLSLLVVSTFSACETSGQNALLGAATGAAIGGALHGRGDQALAGAAIGAAGGYLIGKVVQNDRRRSYEAGYNDGRYGDRYERYPVARTTGSRGLVISPYSPYNRIDVRGIPHGAQVVDPSTNRIFINP